MTKSENLAEEAKLINEIQTLSQPELAYMSNRLMSEYPNGCVLCCVSLQSGELLKKILFNDGMCKISCIDNIAYLKTNDDVIFTTFDKIRNYRETHKVKIKSVITLKHLLLNTKNNFLFRQKYLDLIKHFDEIGVGFFYGIIPEKNDLDLLSKQAVERLSGNKKIDEKLYEVVLGGNKTGDYLACKLQDEHSRVIYNGIHNVLDDYNSAYYNVINGMRLTYYQPKEYKNTIFLFGPCTARGALVEDKHTVASFLQKKINEKGFPYLVLNCGVGGGSDLENTYRYILSLPIVTGDIVLLLEEGQFLKDLLSERIFLTAEAFNTNPIQNEWFIDRPAHCNSEANFRIADFFLKKITNFAEKLETNSCATKERIVNKFKVENEKTFEVGEYLRAYEKCKFPHKEGNSYGAIVVHCNPMTLGHKYLIEKALEYVNYLYVFIISEDKSFVPYKIRKNILLNELKSYENVKVLDSGKYMASVSTFPEYFSKHNCESARIDAAKDILMFCQYVAPTLEITKRFVGTEPNDFVTRQYNNLLKIFLPIYGIEVYEFERISNNGEYISARIVRDLIKLKKWDKVKTMIPESALKILKWYY